MYRKILLLLLFLIPFRLLSAQDCTVIGVLPKGYTPEEVGQKLAYRFVDKGNIQDRKGISYFYTFNWNGALKFAEVANDTMLFSLLQKNFEPLFNSKKQILPGKVHVDMNMFGCLPLEFYHVTKDQRYYNLGISYADTQWQLPDNAKQKEKEWHNKGYSWQTRLWIDDAYMITVVQTHAYKVTGDYKYIDRAAKEMVLYLDELQCPNGLFYHAPDVPYYWGRGNGWMAAGMADLLRYLPENHKNRARIMEGYHLMMESLLKYQNEEGLWNQLIDKMDCWTETSGTAMFTYAFILGIKYGWLDKAIYAPAARKAWMGMVDYIARDGAVREVCVGTNKKNSEQYYYDRPRNSGDYHGQSPYLWCAVALLEK